MTSLPDFPRTEADARPPRPGWAKALGISHITIASLSSLMLIVSIVYALIFATSKSADGGPSVMMGMDDPRYLWFVMIDGFSGLIANGFTFASGVALVNLRAWGARVWHWLAPAKIGRLVVVWGGFIVGVAPVLSSNMGQSVAKIMQQQAPQRTLLQNAAQMSLVYAWMFLAMGIGMIVLGSIYPAVTWWLVRRPGIRFALDEGGAEPRPVSPEEARLS